MHTVLVIVGLIAGLALLIKGADIFVDASVGIAHRLKMSPVIIGLTIVSMGTSIPELVISVSAAAGGANDLAVANAVGANTFNLLMILGLAAMVRAIPVDFRDISKGFWLSVAAPAFLLLLFFTLGNIIPRWGGLAMFVVYIAYIVILVKTTPKDTTETEVPPGGEKKLSRYIGHALLATFLIFIGGQITVWASEALGPILGLSERVVGLTIVAISTSLPELTFTLIACKRGENEMAVGTIIGSNVFNLMAVLGLSGIILPLTISTGSVIDLSLLVLGSLLFFLFVTTRRRIARAEGLVMAVIYVGYIVYLLIA
ncbi:MAG: calcium/sodium antiporter [Defluviitaleaceae bacterium]|nr:calcium/sodium antiporter [Defluviitaleaceae bacterium]MCL2239392.1 calcium/sodium antiporter [Defluviitaleaceae bacterium]